MSFFFLHFLSFGFRLFSGLSSDFCVVVFLLFYSFFCNSLFTLFLFFLFVPSASTSSSSFSFFVSFFFILVSCVCSSIFLCLFSFSSPFCSSFLSLCVSISLFLFGLFSPC